MNGLPNKRVESLCRRFAPPPLTAHRSPLTAHRSRARMPDKLPTVREIAWVSTIPQIALIAALIGLAWIVISDRPTALAVGALTYLLLSRGSRAIIAKHHNRGIRLLRANRFDEAVGEFERSYVFFSRHAWLDRWRYLTLLSSSAYSYRELALCNIAFAHLQKERVADALTAYRKAVCEFPNCALAATSIRALEAVQRQSAA